MKVRKDDTIINTEVVREIALIEKNICFYGEAFGGNIFTFSTEEVAKQKFENLWQVMKIPCEFNWIDLTEGGEETTHPAHAKLLNREKEEVAGMVKVLDDLAKKREK